MKLHKTVVVLLALLLAGMAMIPMVSAIPDQLPQLQENPNQDLVMIGNDLSPD